MDLTRRQFARRLTTGLAMVFSGTWCTLKASRPVRTAIAARDRFFPGRVRPLDKDKIDGPGPWAG